MRTTPRARQALIAALAALFLAVTATSAAAREKPRLVVLTDIGGDPDDQMSMVRLLFLAVTDHGTLPLTRYKRVLIDVK